jgi:hypothetical protein
MMTEKLQTAIDKLHIHDIYLRNHISRCLDGFEPKYEQHLEKLEIRSKHVVKQIRVVKLDDTQLVLQTFVELGVRWVNPDILDKKQAIMAFIEAEFIAEYLMDEELEQTCIDEFALKNVSYHIWPYWRELLMSQCSRMHLPRLVLPTMQLAHNRNISSSACGDLEA